MKDSQSHRCGEASAGAEVFAGQDAEPSVRWRKRPVVVEAWRFMGCDQWRDLPDWIADVERVYGTPQPGEVQCVADLEDEAGYLRVHTLEGVHRANPGDWIIRGIQGELYPCKPDIFAATYDPDSPAQDALLIERAAEKVYDAMVWAALTRERPVPNWTEGGNSLAQYEARRAARYVLALGASATAPAEPGWQPISSAPRDGTPILVAHSSNGAVFTVNWDEGAAGWVDGATDNYDDLVTYSPSHWMPLPAPPVEAATPAHAELSPGNSSDLRGEEG